MTVAATGPQYTLTAEGARATIGALAGVLRSLEVAGGVHLTEPFSTETLPPFGDGSVLVPWPNRVRDAIWVHEGVPQKLDVTEVARGNALHGLLRNTEYQPREQTENSVTLGAVVYPQHGWPFHLDTWVRYDLQPDGITVTHGVENLGATRAPYAVGTHPFLRVGDAEIATTTITAPAESYFVVDERLNPTGTAPVEGTPTDLRSPRPVGELDLDTAYGSLVHADVIDGAGASAWLTAPDGARTTLWQGVDFPYLQVFTTPIFPRAEGLGLAVAIEPMTAPPDALNSGEGLRWLESGESWQGSWGIRYSPAPASTPAPAGG